MGKDKEKKKGEEKTPERVVDIAENVAGISENVTKLTNLFGSNDEENNVGTDCKALFFLCLLIAMVAVGDQVFLILEM